MTEDDVLFAGLGTVAAALSASVPLVCMPSGRDQADNAVRVVEAGAGIRLSARARPAKIRAAIERTLSDAGLRAAAERMREAFARDAAGAATSALERLASTGAHQL